MKRPSRSTAASPSERLSTIVCSNSVLCPLVAVDRRISTLSPELGRFLSFLSPVERAAGVPISGALCVQGVAVSLTLDLTVMLKMSYFAVDEVDVREQLGSETAERTNPVEWLVRP